MNNGAVLFIFAAGVCCGLPILVVLLGGLVGKLRGREGGSERIDRSSADAGADR